MSLYDHHLSLSVLLLALLLASVSVDSSPINFQMAAIYMMQLSPFGVNWLQITYVDIYQK